MGVEGCENEFWNLSHVHKFWTKNRVLQFFDQIQFFLAGVLLWRVEDRLLNESCHLVDFFPFYTRLIVVPGQPGDAYTRSPRDLATNCFFFAKNIGSEGWTHVLPRPN